MIRTPINGQKTLNSPLISVRHAHTHTHRQRGLYHLLNSTAKSINVKKKSKHPEYHYNIPPRKSSAAVTTLMESQGTWTSLLFWTSICCWYFFFLFCSYSAFPMHSFTNQTTPHTEFCGYTPVSHFLRSCIQICMRFVCSISVH